MSYQRCNRCHRKLKTPESMEIGFGSACYKKLFGKTLKQSQKTNNAKINNNSADERQEIEGQITCFDESEVLSDEFKRNG